MHRGCCQGIMIGASGPSVSENNSGVIRITLKLSSDSRPLQGAFLIPPALPVVADWGRAARPVLCPWAHVLDALRDAPATIVETSRHHVESTPMICWSRVQR